MKPLKRWLSFEDQLRQLEARGLTVDDSAATLDYLERLGYYRLSGYWYPLRKIDVAASRAQGKPVRQDVFIENSRFEHVVQLYVFDKKLRLLTMDALERCQWPLLLTLFWPIRLTHPALLPGCFLLQSIALTSQHKYV